MTAFATCAYTGCYERIPYDPKEDAIRPRYCDKHMVTMASRGISKLTDIGERINDYDNKGLYICVVYRRD